MPITLIVIIVLVILIVIYIVGIFNSLITLKNRSDEAWSDIDVQLKRRYSLIPNLVETVKGYAKHETKVFTDVTEARASAISAKGIKGQQEAENMLTGALKSVFAVAESYPELEASENFGKLQDELSDTENKIEAARRFYNANVRDLNIKIEMFPSSIVANMFKIIKKELFELENVTERETPKVKFDEK
ncbi:MAG: LemA-like protein [Berkelbacteria bacterium GW2011_GWA2_38_9]|uniref:LemA-like protein n=1 Tax=Berkelbacteria bacterium GW2011_GWA2_38_9 TaxID=1618334 RepID=A0A0G0LDL7_9BACT|nr:MAG: LemA-like protein [Berkelbacteria bacterium GW2011_GWA2_38_9]